MNEASNFCNGQCSEEELQKIQRLGRQKSKPRATANSIAKQSCLSHRKVARTSDILIFAGLWIDMNEAVNFCDGYCDDEQETRQKKPTMHLRTSLTLFFLLISNLTVCERVLLVPRSTEASLAAGFDPNNPPYAINNEGNHLPLDTHALYAASSFLCHLCCPIQKKKKRH